MGGCRRWRERPSSRRQTGALRMKLFYGWVIVGAGIVITCIGFGTALCLGVFLEPMAAATGWSRGSISAAAMVDFLCMGVASLFWGALSDRHGTRLVVLCG